MHRPGFIWKFYAFYWSFLSIHAAADIFSTGSPANLFYQIMGAFHWSFSLIYGMDIVSSILNLISLVPLFGFTFQKKMLSPGPWKTLFLLRAAFDLCGNYYEFVTLKSFFAGDPWLGVQVVAGILLTMIPSYAACYQYAFASDKLFPRK